MLLIEQLRFVLRFEEDAVLPAWKGRVLRGALGDVLWRISCRRRKAKECETCELNPSCAYGYLFRATSPGAFSTLTKVKHLTKPYALQPPSTQQKKFKASERLEFKLNLFGRASSFKRELLDAINVLERVGLGPYRCKFRVERVFVENPIRNESWEIYNQWDGSLLVGSGPKCGITIGDLRRKVKELEGFSGSLRIEWITPFRLLTDDGSLLVPDFPRLVAFLMRKFSTISKQHCFWDPNWDWKAVLESAKDVSVGCANDLKPRTFMYNGQKEVFLVGKQEFYVSDLPSEIAILLSFGEFSNVGKRASYGHGMLAVSPKPLSSHDEDKR